MVEEIIPGTGIDKENLMITGHVVGTEVKWNEGNDLTVGVVDTVFREPQTIEVNGRIYEVGVSQNSPSYLIRKSDGELVVLGHQMVMRRHVNMHT